MIQISAQMRDAQFVSKRFEEFAKNAATVSMKTAYDIVFKARNRLATYPTKYAGTPEHHWASERQRRYVMMMIKLGKIRVPYRRTGKYGWEWRIRRDDMAGGDGVTYLLYNRMPYAMWVGGDEQGGQQYHIHQTRWRKLQAAAQEIQENAAKTVERKIIEIARRRGF